jgi:hypothetical protein
MMHSHAGGLNDSTTIECGEERLTKPLYGITRVTRIMMYSHTGQHQNDFTAIKRSKVADTSERLTIYAPSSAIAYPIIINKMSGSWNLMKNQ